MSSKNSDAESVARLAIDVARSLWRENPKELPSKPEPRLQKSESDDAIARRAIEAGRLLGARTAREAAEMTAGRPLTDDEWSGLGSTLERVWRENPKERPSEPEPRLHQLRLAIATVSDEPNFGKDPTGAAAKAAALLTRALVKKTISTIGDEDDRFVAGIFAFVFSNYFTIVVGGSFEEASVIALSEVIGTEEGDRCLTTIGNSYNQMIHSKPKITEALGKTCEAWFNNPDAAQFQKLVELFKIFRTHLR